LKTFEVEERQLGEFLGLVERLGILKKEALDEALGDWITKYKKRLPPR
jgi:hypothetical protein